MPLIRSRNIIIFLHLTIIITSLLLARICWGMTAKQIAEKSFPSVVVLVMQGEDNQYSMGSGFFIQKNTIATNFHVIKGAKKGYTKVIGSLEQYEILGTLGIDEKNDLAILSVKGSNAPSLFLGNSGNVQIGDEIFAIGNPMGLEGTISNGIISGVRIIEEGETRFQISAPISQGNSGGPLLNTEGEVIGISYAGLNKGQNLNFAIPTYYLKLLIENKEQLKPLKKSKNQLEMGGLYIFVNFQNMEANKENIEILDRIGRNGTTIKSPSFHQGIKLERGKYVIVYKGIRVFDIEINPNNVNKLYVR